MTCLYFSLTLTLALRGERICERKSPCIPLYKRGSVEERARNKFMAIRNVKCRGALDSVSRPGAKSTGILGFSRSLSKPGIKREEKLHAVQRWPLRCHF